MEKIFRYVLKPLPRIVGYGIEFPDMPCIGEAEAFEPAPLEAETVALPARLLPAVWDTVWTPIYPAVIFTGPGYGELTDTDRDLIWKRWGVPVYEHRLTASGDLMAEECDAHESLHLRSEFASSRGAEHRRCACGRAGPVLTTLSTEQAPLTSESAGRPS